MSEGTWHLVVFGALTVASPLLIPMLRRHWAGTHIGNVSRHTAQFWPFPTFAMRRLLPAIHVLFAFLGSYLAWYWGDRFATRLGAGGAALRVIGSVGMALFGVLLLGLLAFRRPRSLLPPWRDRRGGTRTRSARRAEDGVAAQIGTSTARQRKRTSGLASTQAST